MRHAKAGRAGRGLVLGGVPAECRGPASGAARDNFMVVRGAAQADGAWLHRRRRPHGVLRRTRGHGRRRVRADRPDAASAARALRQRTHRSCLAHAADRRASGAGTVHRAGGAGQRQRPCGAGGCTRRIGIARSARGQCVGARVLHVRAHAVAPHPEGHRQEHAGAGAERAFAARPRAARSRAG